MFVFLLGVFVPGANSDSWLQDSPATPFFYAFLPGILAASIASDAFAGERERHTLETLLATPLSELTILCGKAFAAISYGMSVAFAGVVVSTVTINVSAGAYVPSVAMVLGALGAALASTIGMVSVAILVSMKVPVARSAHQIAWMSSVALVAGVLGVWKGLDLPLTWKNVAVAEICLALVGLAVFDLARAQFRRERFFDAG